MDSPERAPEAESSTGGSSVGLDKNLAGALSYSLGFITGIVFLVMEKKNDYIRFHAMQSVLLFLPICVAQVVLSFVPLLGWLLQAIIGLAAVILWVLLMLKAFQGERYHLPVVGALAEERLKQA